MGNDAGRLLFRAISPKQIFNSTVFTPPTYLWPLWLPYCVHPRIPYLSNSLHSDECEERLEDVRTSKEFCFKTLKIVYLNFLYRLNIEEIRAYPILIFFKTKRKLLVFKSLKSKLEDKGLKKFNMICDH